MRKAHGGDVLCFEVKCFDVLMSVAGSGHVMVTSFDAMWWLALCHVTWCNAMSWWWAVLLQYYKVLFQYYSVLQILLCTTKYYSSTTLYYKVLLKYYKVLLQYYLVLQSTTPVLPCTTKYYSSTNLYYKVLRLPRKMNLMIDPHHIWSVIYNARSNSQHPPTSPNTAPATQNESHDWSTSHMKRHLQCAEQQSTPSNLTKYCTCHAKWPPNIW